MTAFSRVTPAPAPAGGTVLRVLPRALYAIRCEDGRRVLATLGEALRRIEVALTPGDHVTVEISHRDPGRGRVVARG